MFFVSLEMCPDLLEPVHVHCIYSPLPDAVCKVFLISFFMALTSVCCRFCIIVFLLACFT